MPPDKDRAKEDAAAEKYLRGKAPILDTRLEQLGELGVVSLSAAQVHMTMGFGESMHA